MRSGRKSYRVNITVPLSLEEKTDDARACVLSGHCPFNLHSCLIVTTSFPGNEVGLVMICLVLGDPGADSGGEGKSKWPGKKMAGRMAELVRVLQ